MAPPTPPSPARPSPPQPLVLAVLGGICSGKSTVATRLAGPQGLVLDADRLAREALEGLVPTLVEAFGPGVVGADGRPDREALARLVFGRPAERRRLEGWIHPIVRERILAALSDAAERGVERVVLDVPLLLENEDQHGFVALCQHLVFVDAPGAERERRAVAGRGWSPGEVDRREATQLPLDAKRKRADHVVKNDGTPEELNAAVDELLANLGLR